MKEIKRSGIKKERQRMWTLCSGSKWRNGSSITRTTTGSDPDAEDGAQHNRICSYLHWQEGCAGRVPAFALQMQILSKR